MTNYDDTNRGALFKVADKESEKHPDYSGNLNVGGTEYKIAGWIRKSKAGATYMSLSVSEATAKPKGKPQARNEDDDNSIPF